MLNNDGWSNIEQIPSKTYICGICGENICSNEGYNYYYNNGYGLPIKKYIYICHNCNSPTYFDFEDKQIPGSKYGDDIKYLPEDIGDLFNEARNCYSVNAFTSTVLCCRKILMSVACESGANEGKNFIEYVNYLDNNHYIPINTKPFVDKIRLLGNDGTHKLENRTKEDAELALNFTSILLKNIYEMPKLLENS